MEYWVHVVNMVAIYGVAAAGLLLLARDAGLVSLLQAGLAGVGAYTFALLVTRLGWSPWSSLPIALAAACCMAWLCSAPTLRIRDDYFALATFAVQIVLTAILTNAGSWTGGPLGIPGIPPFDVGTVRLGTPLRFLPLSLCAAIGTAVLVWRLRTAPFGRLLRAIRDDEVFASSLGKSIVDAKRSAFVVSAGIAAVAGTLLAGYMSYIDPTAFDVMESILLLTIVVVSGSRSAGGILGGAALLVGAPELLRFLNVSGGRTANVREIVFGALLIGVMMLRRREPYAHRA